MSRTRFLVFAGMLFVLLSSLAACSSLSAPRQIATYPLSTPFSQPDTWPAYNIYLELEVPDVASAADSAILLAYQAGGMLVDSQSWRQDGDNHNTLVLAVPSGHAATFERALLELGRPVQEQPGSQVMDWPVEGRDGYVYFTVYFQFRQETLPPFPQSDWAPMRILARAWSVSVSILGFLLTVLICLAIIIGPFVLIGAAVWAVIQSLRS